MTEGVLERGYLATTARIDALVRGLDADAWERAVPACPGWRVRDVIGHLLGIVEDGAAGRIRGIPDEAMTAEQIERHRGEDPVAVLDAWVSVAPLMAAAIEQGQRWPGLIDAVTHEHDLRGALGVTGPVDDETLPVVVLALARALVDGVAGLRVELEGRPFGPDDAELVLATTGFELFRARMGRRTRDEVAALGWSTTPPDEVVEAVFVFGPTPVSLGERASVE